jgi:DNA (cytosine-5)-methyltransferase 1
VHSVREPLRTVTAFPKGGSFALAAPTIIPATHQGDYRVHDPKDPLPTITAAHRGELMVSMPYMVQAGHGEGTDKQPRHSHGVKDIKAPLGTVVASGGGHALAAATLVQTGYGERIGQAPRSLDIEKPLGTVVAGGIKHALASAHLVKFRGDSIGTSIDEPVPTITSGAGAKRPAGAAHALGLATAYVMQANGGFNETPGHDAREPMSTITNRGSQQQVVAAFLSRQFGNSVGQEATEPAPTTTAGGGGKTSIVAAHLAHLRGNCDARDLNDPLHTVSAAGQHHAVVEYRLSPEDEAGALRVAAFLLEFYGEAHPDTITTKDLLALVTVMIRGVPYVIVDIGLRMLIPRELYRAQGFREHYIIDYGHDGRKFTKDQQVRMVGNSVPPDVIAAIYSANLGELALRRSPRRVNSPLRTLL